MSNEFLRLDPSDIRYLHDEQIRLFGGIYGENNPQQIDYAADKPFLSLLGKEEIYPTVFQKAAVYLVSFARNQYFADGNKRTGIKCALTFLAINGYQVEVTNDELFEFTMAVVRNPEIGIDEIANWFEKNSIREDL